MEVLFWSMKYSEFRWQLRSQPADRQVKSWDCRRFPEKEESKRKEERDPLEGKKPRRPERMVRKRKNTR